MEWTLDMNLLFINGAEPSQAASSSRGQLVMKPPRRKCVNFFVLTSQISFEYLIAHSFVAVWLSGPCLRVCACVCLRGRFFVFRIGYSQAKKGRAPVLHRTAALLSLLLWWRLQSMTRCRQSLPVLSGGRKSRKIGNCSKTSRASISSRWSTYGAGTRFFAWFRRRCGRWSMASRWQSNSINTLHIFGRVAEHEHLCPFCIPIRLNKERSESWIKHLSKPEFKQS